MLRPSISIQNWQQSRVAMLHQKLVVDYEPPHQILATETGLDEILEHSTEDLRCQSLQVFEGPRTDVGSLHMAIQSAGSGDTSGLRTVLYDKYGQPQVRKLSFTQYHDPTKIVRAIMMTIENSDAILVNDAFMDIRPAQVLVAAEWPFHLQMINEEFTTLFAYNPPQIVGQTMNIVESPRTDTSKFRSLFECACEGQGVSGVFFLSTRWKVDIRVTVVCIPVVEKPNGKIKFVLIKFYPTSNEDGYLCQFNEGQEQQYFEPGQAIPFIQRVENDFANHKSIAESLQQTQLGSPTMKLETIATDFCGLRTAATQPKRDKRNHCPKIYPRRKSHETKTDVPSSPVVITLELLEKLSDIPLYRAAEKIGVSATALKLACRKLGVRKWQCKKKIGTSHASPGSELNPIYPHYPKQAPTLPGSMCMQTVPRRPPTFLDGDAPNVPLSDVPYVSGPSAARSLMSGVGVEGVAPWNVASSDISPSHGQAPVQSQENCTIQNHIPAWPTAQSVVRPELEVPTVMSLTGQASMDTYYGAPVENLSSPAASASHGRPSGITDCYLASPLIQQDAGSSSALNPMVNRGAPSTENYFAAANSDPTLLAESACGRRLPGGIETFYATALQADVNQNACSGECSASRACSTDDCYFAPQVLAPEGSHVDTSNQESQRGIASADAFFAVQQGDGTSAVCGRPVHSEMFYPSADSGGPLQPSLEGTSVGGEAIVASLQQADLNFRSTETFFWPYSGEQESSRGFNEEGCA